MTFAGESVNSNGDRVMMSFVFKAIILQILPGRKHMMQLTTLKMLVQLGMTSH